MSFWCHRFDQKTNKNFVRISALKVFKGSLRLPGSFLGLPLGFLIDYKTYQETPTNFKEAPRKLQKVSGQKSLQYFRCYFSPNDDTKKDISKLTDL